MYNNKMPKAYIYLTFVIFNLSFCLVAQAWALPFRSDLNRANDFYQKGKYSQAESAYNKVLKQRSNDQKVKFNLGDTLYKQGRLKDSQKLFEGLTLEAETTDLRAKSFYNLGNTYFKQDNFDSAIRSYEETLKLKPNDKDTQFNLALAKKMKARPRQKKEKQKKKQEKKKKEKQPKPKPEQMSKEDARRILNALQGKEKHQAQKAKAGKGTANVKDW